MNPDLLSITVFVAASIAGLGIVVFFVTQLSFTNDQSWPPPNPTFWQYHTIRWMFRLMLLGLVVLSIVDYGALSTNQGRLIVGVPISILGFGAAFYLTHFLGWRNAFGADDGLKTSGAYQWSRNPIYVVSFVGMMGWGITIASYYVWALLAIWAVFYIVAPFVEEPWLTKHYGKDYLDYRSKVRRFL